MVSIRSTRESMDRWRRGAIKSVSVSGWMAFEEEEEFEFGSGINVVCAANASGKSALVGAIALGLGYKVSLLGRAKTVDALICKKKTKCSIEVTIAKEDLSDEQVTIRRDMHRLGHGQVSSNWLIDNRPSSLENVRELQRDFNFQVDSLVSFLPQDRVGEFASLNGRLLLECVLKAVNLDYANLLGDLTKLEKNIDRLQQELTLRNTEEAGLIEQQSRFARVLQGWQQAQRWTRDVELMDKRIAELKLEAAKNKLFESQRTLQELDAEEQEKIRTKRKIEKMLKTDTAKEKKLNDQSEALQAKERDVRNAIFQLNADCLYREEQYRVLKQSTESIESTLRDWETKFDQIKSKLENGMRRKEQLKLTPEDRKRTRELEESVKKKCKEREEIGDQLQRLKSQQTQAERNRAKLLEDRDKLTRESSKKLWHVLNQCRDPDMRYRMQAAIRELKVEAQLPVDGSIPPAFGPLAAYIDVPEHLAGLMHSCLGHRTMYFVVDSTLSDSFKRFRLGSLSVPEKPQFYMKVTDRLRGVGVSFFLHEGIEHLKLRDILTQYCQLSTIAIMAQGHYEHGMCDEDHKRVCECLAAELRQQFQNFSETSNSRLPIRYFLGNQLYTVETDRYNPNATYTSVRTVARSSLLTSHTSEAQGQQKMEQLDGSIDKLAQQIERLTVQAQEEHHHFLQIKDEYFKASDILATYRDEIQKYQSIERHIKTLQQQLSVVEQQKPDVEKENEIVCQKVKENSKKVHENIEKIETLKGQLVDIEEKKKAFKEKAIVTASGIQHHRQELEGANREYSERAVLRIRTRSAHLTYQQNVLLITKEVEQFAITDEERAEMLTRFSGTLHRLQEDREHTRMKRDALTRNATDELNYELLCVSLKECREAIAEQSQQLTESREQLKRDGRRFKEYVQTITRTINRRFESFMSQMKPTYKGRIAQTGGETFESCGLNLEVRFRDGDPFRPLASGYQSGGEKSCAAMVFILSLQGTSHAPFRVVDEINQGLDSNNEIEMMRLVGEIANVKNDNEPHSQYIILTPQLVGGVIQSGFHVLWVANRPDIEEDSDANERLKRPRPSIETQRDTKRINPKASR